jgi:hypothetical protein
MAILGAVLTTIGTLLTLWSVLYARTQGKKVSDLKRNQNITLWATLARVARSISDVRQMMGDDAFIEDGILSEKQKQVLPKIHRGLADQFIRLAELIIQNDVSITKSDIEKWLAEKRPGVETEWRKNQFVNLILAGSNKSDSNNANAADTKNRVAG